MDSTFDLTGMRVNMLTVLKLVGKEKKQTVWLCRCDCGKEVQIGRRKLMDQDIYSCGCSRKPVELCKFNSGVNCAAKDICQKCGWNPEVYAFRREKA